MSNTALREFIERQLEERSMSAREFARFVGVSSSTISRTMAFNSNTEPTLSFLNKLAAATNTSLCYLVELIYPQPSRGIDPDIARLAEQIGNLPIEAQQLIDSMILGMTINNRNRSSDIS